MAQSSRGACVGRRRQMPTPVMDRWIRVSCAACLLKRPR